MLKGKLISTYLGKAKKIPAWDIQIIIMDKPPFEVSEYPQYEWFKDLAPYENLRRDLKDGGIDWPTFSRVYINKLQNNPSCNEAMGRIMNYINAGKDVYIICCEKDYTKCHRYLLGRFMEEEYNVYYKEME